MNSTSSCIIQANPDITGIGVRISTYALSLGAPIISALFPSKPELRESVEKSLGVTGFSLLLTAFVFAGRQQLDLFHSICLFHLIALVGLTITPSNIKFRNTFHRRLVYGFFYAGGLGFIAFVIYVLAVAPRFGATPACNHTIRFVVFGIGVPATDVIFRCLFIANIVAFLPIASLMAQIRKVINKTRFSTIFYAPPAQRDGISALNKTLSEAACRIYIIVMIELLLKRNSIGPGEAEWSFGQILPMMTLVGPVYQFDMELSEALKDNSRDLSDVMKHFKFMVLQRSIRIAFILSDFAFSATAGAAAAAAGAHSNGSKVTAEIVRLGALAGVIGSGILNFCAFVSSFTVHTMQFALMFGVSSFGIAFLVVLAIGQRLLDEVPDAMLIGSLAAAVPMLAGSLAQAGVPNSTGYIPVSPIFDALAGFTFVKVSQNRGYYVCRGRTAAGAGAVYGFMLWILRMPQTIFYKKERERLQWQAERNRQRPERRRRQQQYENWLMGTR